MPVAHVSIRMTRHAQRRGILQGSSRGGRHLPPDKAPEPPESGKYHEDGQAARTEVPAEDERVDDDGDKQDEEAQSDDGERST